LINRNVIIGVRLTQKEYEYLCKKAKQDPDTRYKNGDKNLSGYIRNYVLKGAGYGDIHIRKEIENMAYQIRKIGVNINQATRKINSGYGTAKAVSELQADMAHLTKSFDEFIDKITLEGGTLWQ
jgi:hypothetical protein